MVAVVPATVPVPVAPAVPPGEGGPPGVFLVAPEVVPGVEDGAALGFVARGSPSSVGPQPATMSEKTKRANRAMEILFIPKFNDSAHKHSKAMIFPTRFGPNHPQRIPYRYLII